MHEFALWGSGAPKNDLGGAIDFPFVKLADESREDVGGLQVKVVAGAVKIVGISDMALKPYCWR